MKIISSFANIRLTYRLFILCFCCTVLAGLTSVPSSATTNRKDMKAALEPYIAQHQLAGAVTLVVSRDRVLTLDAVGYADVKTEAPMTRDTLFWIASMGKPIAATALMMLVEDGKVRLDDPVVQYLPRFQPREMVITADRAHVELQQPRNPITLRDLLSHVSGVPYISSLEGTVLDRHPLPLRVESYALEPLLFEPRTDFSYSDAGINTISRVIEVVSGLDYSTFLGQRLFGPLGMRDTTFWPTEAQVARLAKSYISTPDGRSLLEIPIDELHYPLSDRITRFPTAAGGLFSTASDLGRFCMMLLSRGTLDGRHYLSEKSIDEMSRNQLPEEALAKFIGQGYHGPTSLTPNGYGLGWFTAASGAFQHGGAYSTSMRIDPVQGIATIWLVQYAGRAPGSIVAHDKFEELAIRWYGGHSAGSAK